MVDWSDDCRRWLCGRGRRPNIYAAITTLLLIVIAVQRRESTDDSSTLDTTDHRRRHAASPVMDTSRDLEVTDQQLQPVVGLFLLVDLDNMHEEQWNQTLHGSPSQCIQEGRDCRIYLLLLTHNASKHAGRRRRLVGDHVTRRVRVCAENSSSIMVHVHVKETVITDRRQDLRTLNIVMMDSYIHDNVDYFYVVYDVVQPSDIDLFDSSSIWPIRHVRHLANMLRNNAILSDSGVITGPNCSLFLGRTHFHIFGLFFPLAVQRISAAVSVVIDLYRSVNLTAWQFVAPTQTGNGVTVVPWSRDRGDNDVINPAQRWPEVFEQQSETLQRYVRVATTSECLYCPISPTTRSLRVISMSLYGSERRYIVGAVRNAQLAPVIFPGWQIRFYCKFSGVSWSRYSPVAAGVVRRLRQLGAQVHYVDGGRGPRLAPMMWRFTIIDDQNVDVFVVRDADGRLTPRDAAVVDDWLRQKPETAATLHCIRDHPGHSDSFINGGLWGARRHELHARFNGSFSGAMLRYSGRYNDDMAFLNRRVWPQVKQVAYCHDSVTCWKYPASFPFPVERRGTEHVGQRYDELSTGNRNDIHDLEQTKVDCRCVPSLRTTARCSKSGR